MNTNTIYQHYHVTGRYFGQDFAGTVRENFRVGHEHRPNRYLIIDLDDAIKAHDVWHTTIRMYVQSDGSTPPNHGEMSIATAERPNIPRVYRYANISEAEARKMYHQHRRLWYSVSSGYWVMHENGEYDSLPEDATKWPPTVELSPSEMKHYLEELT